MSKSNQRNLIAAAVALLSSTGASALELNAGDYKFTVNGNINVHYVYSDCDSSSPVVIGGGLACTGGGGTAKSASAVTNGLLPAALSFGVITQQNGLDIEGHFGLYPGISTNDGGSPNLQGGAGNVGLGTTGLDVRQVYLTVGNKDIGTFTAGRNFGLFGFDAIINDMTIPGVGAAGAAASGTPANTTLGSIGLGYVYTDTLAQMNYTTPAFAGATLTLGIYDPLNSLGGATGRKTQPGFHGKLAYKTEVGGTKVYLSSAFITQQQRDDGGSDDYRSYGLDVGGKVNISDLELGGWYYYGKGLGTTALFLLSSDGNGGRRGSNGYLAQATYKIDAVKVGVNYGVSRLSGADGENATGLVRSNTKITGGVYYSLTKNLLLLSEVTSVTAKAHGGGKNEALNFNVGTFLSF
ncbi:porin [Nevskia sp.]|uniref:porin n=1 Tax=Nevskia sp. TaxID=1929292 RepID=UPI003F716288